MMVNKKEEQEQEKLSQAQRILNKANSVQGGVTRVFSEQEQQEILAKDSGATMKEIEKKEGITIQKQEGPTSGKGKKD